VTETGCAEVDPVLGGDGEDLPDGGRREEGHDKVLEESIAAVEIEIRTTSEVGGLLEEDGIGAKYLTGIYCYFQFLGGKDGVHDGDVRRGQIG